MSGLAARVARFLSPLVRAGGRAALRELERRDTAPAPAPGPASRPSPAPGPVPRGAVEHRGPLRVEYAPRADGRPDPGEVVWAWVPFEEGDGRGKDRPVLVVGRDGEDLLVLAMSSRDHDEAAAAAGDARHGRRWVDVGSGAWDRRGRPSEVRVDRLLRVAAADVRREGAALDRERFEEVAARVRGVHGG
ncbi:type II toxin-antitoxin system PemK/MazF family toxin [Kineococcus sp. SYSU DK004]|uniref:type II toxin-antitoxin system PemK/MazF family toxin n=1 Tax=Kineococcus sp. SYSU DK004 TaxID=3383125 RepID=UPI003D7C7433